MYDKHLKKFFKLLIILLIQNAKKIFTISPKQTIKPLGTKMK